MKLSWKMEPYSYLVNGYRCRHAIAQPMMSSHILHIERRRYTKSEPLKMNQYWHDGIVSRGSYIL